MADNPPKLGELVPEERRTQRDAIHIAVVSVKAGYTLKPGQAVRVRRGWSEDKEELEADTCTPEYATGIVDPFLSQEVKEGEYFWLCLLPGTTTNLKHVWSHPHFTASPPKNTSIVTRVGNSSLVGEMRSQKEAFEVALSLNPYDMVTRKVFADWLDERGLTEDANLQRTWTEEKSFAEETLRKFATDLKISFQELLERMKYLSKSDLDEYGRFDFDDKIHCSGFDDPTYKPKEIWDYYQIFTGSVVEDTKKQRFTSCSC